MEVRRVGVVGCGLMGAGITAACALAGLEVWFVELSQHLVDEGLERITDLLFKAVERGRITRSERRQAGSLITGTTQLEDLWRCQLVIEAVREDIESKRSILTALEEYVPSNAILATNTSSLSVAGIASTTADPGRVVGLHFFNPVLAMPLVEVVAALSTREEALRIAAQFVESIGKTVVLAKDLPGFIVDSLIVPYLLDAVRLVEEEVAVPQDIDKAIRLGCGHPMGPLATADLVGTDTLLGVADILFQETSTLRYTAPVHLRRMVSSALLGRRTRKGFYDYKLVKRELLPPLE